MSAGPIPTAEALRLADLITPTEGGIASRVLARNAGAPLPAPSSECRRTCRTPSMRRRPRACC